MAERESLMRGMNMIAYPGAGGAWIDLGNGTEVWESTEPYWFRMGFSQEVLECSLDTMQKMGVRYVRSCALIFQFMEWDMVEGYMGLNASAISNFNTFIEELDRRGMRLTVFFMGPHWSSAAHPSLGKFYQVFNASNGMSQTALEGVGQAMIDFAEHYCTNGAIFSWDLVGGFSKFLAHLKDTVDGFGLIVDASEIYSLMESTAEGIRAVDTKHYLTMTDDWPWTFGEDSWDNGHVPPFYNESLVELVDYISVEAFSDNSTLPVVRHLQKAFVLSAVASTQPTNRSKNSVLLLDTFSEGLNKSFSGFAPWELSQTAVITETLAVEQGSPVHYWTWDAMLLFTLYRRDSLSFLNTTDYRLFASEPEFTTSGHVTFELSLPEGIEGAGIQTNIVSKNLVMGDPVTSNIMVNVNTLTLPVDALESLNGASTLVRLDDTGRIIESGVRIENSSSWSATVEAYEPRRIRLIVNSSDSADIAVETGSFKLVAGRKYRIVQRDLSSGVSSEVTVEANQFLNLFFSVGAGSVEVQITPLIDLLNLFSWGASAGAVIISLVLYYVIGKRSSRSVIGS